MLEEIKAFNNEPIIGSGVLIRHVYSEAEDFSSAGEVSRKLRIY